MNPSHGTFRLSDLVKVNEADYVTFKSGGYLMKLECTEGENAVVSWWDNEAKKNDRGMFPLSVLRRLAPLDLPYSGKVILGCGGPLMKLERIVGERAIVSWRHKKKTVREMFKLFLLRRLAPMELPKPENEEGES